MIPLFKVNMPADVMEPLKEVLFSGYIGQGRKVEEFEEALTPWVGTRNNLTLNSCTSALHLALRLADVGAGDEVITTPMTCMATNEPILERGGKIVWADIDPSTGTIDPADVEKKITPRTKAIICVHWAGYPCDLRELNDIASVHGIKVIEDAAHAFGALYHGSAIGSYSDFVCFSFQAIKHLTTVDGGLLCCRSRKDYERGKLLRWYGINREQSKGFRCEEDILEHGYKFHMNDVSATIGLVQLQHVQDILDSHRSNAAFYDAELEGLAGLRKLDYQDDRVPSYWMYSLLVEDKSTFQLAMDKAGIQVSPVHVRNDIHSVMQPFSISELPGVDEFSKRQVSIPVGWWVTEEDRARVVNAAKDSL